MNPNSVGGIENDAVIRSRKSVRAFWPDPISRRVVTEIIEVAGGLAPTLSSGVAPR
jgi:hypothetical protein